MTYVDWGSRCNRYFEGGVSSVYLWDLDDGGFAGVVLLKKSAYQRPLTAICKFDNKTISLLQR